MADLKTTYMGLKLANPLVIASSSLSKNLDGIKRCAAAGAGAIVLKSLFEEQLQANIKTLEPYLWMSGHSEAFEYIKNFEMELGPENYLELISAAKKAIAIPVIASINCVSPHWWTDYARRIETAGADGLELNIASLANNPKHEGTNIEEIYLRIVADTRSRIKIPLAVKLSPQLTAPANLVREVHFRGAQAVVLFNRFFQFDIDIEKIKVAPGPYFSTPLETHLPLRWISVLYEKVACDLASATGIHTHADVIKHLLAGATVTQICSTLYLHQLNQINKILDGLRDWMERHGFSQIADFRGMLSQNRSQKPEIYMRLQYIKNLVGIE